MAEISRVAVFGKLNPMTYKAVEGATVFCKLRGNPYVELEHWIAQIVQNPDSDWHRIIKHYDLDAAGLARDLLYTFVWNLAFSVLFTALAIVANWRLPSANSRVAPT